MPSALHVKSHASPGIGVHPPEALVARAAALGYGAVALTDVENLYAQVRFHHAARAFGIRAITGVELRSGFSSHSPGSLAGRVVLLARDRAGYESLCRIVSRRRLAPLPTSDPLASWTGEEPGLLALSDDGLPGTRSFASVAAPDVLFLEEDDALVHRLLAAIRAGCRVGEVRNPESGLFEDPAALRARFGVDAVAEGDRLAAECTLDLTEAQALPPRLSGAADPLAELATRCRARLPVLNASYEARLAHELSVIGQLGFADLFLVVGEIVAEAERRGIAVAARGSASGSLVDYLLGAGGVDPLAHGLLFERFLHAHRKRPPDIDLDLSSARREEILDWVFARWGEERVAMVSAHQTFGRRSALREGLKALAAPSAEGDLFKEPVRIPPDPLPLLERLVGAFRTVSVHPGGIVIADPRIDSFVPLERAPKGIAVTQFDMHALESTGLVKIDLLGNRALSALESLPGDTPDGDPATLALLREGRTVGCFQLETPVVRPTLQKLPVRGIEDVVAALAIVRPGPASGEAKAAFIRRAHGEEPSDPPHPRLAELTATTYGLLLYEEQITQAIALLTGWALDRADALREAIADERADALAFQGAALATGLSIQEAERLWSLLERFASYSFNKAHAVSYARIAWATAYHKAHHPAEFARATLAHYGGAYTMRTIAAEFARLVPVRAPHVHWSDEGPALEDGGVRLGLATIGHLGARGRAHILSARPFEDVADFVRRVPLARAELEALVLSGALDDLAPLEAALYPTPHLALLGRPSPRARGARAATWRALYRASRELQYLGMHPSAHPMAILRAEASAAGCVPMSEIVAGPRVRVAGMVAASRRWRGTVHFVTFEDETGLLETVLPSRTYRALGDPVKGPGPWIVEGEALGDHGSVTLRVGSVAPFHRRARPYMG